MPRALATTTSTITSKSRKGRRDNVEAPPDPIACRECDDRLEWLQPADDRPDILLGVCDGCGTWHVLGGSGGQRGVSAIVAIPGTARPRRPRRAKSG